MKARSWLFVPGDSDRKLAAAGRSGADAAIIDLEDAVLPRRKETARRGAATRLAARRSEAGMQWWVRVNAVSSGLLEADLAAVVPAAPDGIVLPKADGVADIERLDLQLAELESTSGLAPGHTRVLAFVTETPQGLFSLAGYAAAPGRLAGLAWGAEDLAAALGSSRNRDANGEFTFTYQLARSACLLAAANAGRAAIETVYTDLRDAAGLERFARRARMDGFTGMCAIHPAQVPVINAAFTPDEAQLAAAQRVVDAFAAAGDAGVVELDGRMLDRPHLAQARRLLEQGD